jgi:2-keto-3-deoxy-6-phosphogluconate aldolase
MSAENSLGRSAGRYEDNAPVIESHLRHNIVRVPREIEQATGIIVFGRRIKSLLYSTDIALIKNCDADAVFCVYPFTAQRSISSAIIHAASVPVFCGVGGGITQGERSAYLAMDAESQGAMGVVLNDPIPNSDIRLIAGTVDIPIVVTIVNDTTDIAARLDAGTTVLNVAGGAKTPDIIAKIRKDFPRVPIIPAGGRTGERIPATIEAGANAIVYSPPNSSELTRKVRDGDRSR